MKKTYLLLLPLLVGVQACLTGADEVDSLARALKEIATTINLSTTNLVDLDWTLKTAPIKSTDDFNKFLENNKNKIQIEIEKIKEAWNDFTKPNATGALFITGKAQGVDKKLETPFGDLKYAYGPIPAKLNLFKHVLRNIITTQTTNVANLQNAAYYKLAAQEYLPLLTSSNFGHAIYLLYRWGKDFKNMNFVNQTFLDQFRKLTEALEAIDDGSSKDLIYIIANADAETAKNAAQKIKILENKKIQEEAEFKGVENAIDQIQTDASTEIENETDTTKVETIFTKALEKLNEDSRWKGKTANTLISDKLNDIKKNLTTTKDNRIKKIKKDSEDAKKLAIEQWKVARTNAIAKVLADDTLKNSALMKLKLTNLKNEYVILFKSLDNIYNCFTLLPGGMKQFAQVLSGNLIKDSKAIPSWIIIDDNAKKSAEGLLTLFISQDITTWNNAKKDCVEALFKLLAFIDPTLLPPAINFLDKRLGQILATFEDDVKKLIKARLDYLLLLSLEKQKPSELDKTYSGFKPDEQFKYEAFEWLDALHANDKTKPNEETLATYLKSTK